MMSTEGEKYAEAKGDGILTCRRVYGIMAQVLMFFAGKRSGLQRMKVRVFWRIFLCARTYR